MQTLEYVVPAPQLIKSNLYDTVGVTTDRPTIWVDLDGVLYNFEGKLQEESGIDARNRPDDEFWSIFNGSKPEGFFARLEPFDDYFEFLCILEDYSHHYGYDLKFLSALSPRNAVSLDDQVRDKNISLEKWVNPWFDIEPVYVLTSAHKKDYAKKGDVLIDDLKSNIADWRERGGTGIHHKNFDESIRELEAVFQLLHPTLH